MRIRNASDDGVAMRFEIHGGSMRHANALRSALLTRVPCLAFDYVTMLENTSAMPDELIAHRIGMLVVQNGPDRVVEMNTPADERTWRNTATFDLVADGPCTIRSEHFVPRLPNAATVLPGTPFLRLVRGQRVRIVAEATIGTGDTHARWNCAVAPGYKPMPLLEVKGAGDIEDLVPALDAGALARMCHQGVFDNDNRVVHPTRCDLCMDCEKYVSVDTDERVVLFQFESTGAVPREEMLRVAIQSVVNDLHKLEDCILSDQA